MWLLGIDRKALEGLEASAASDGYDYYSGSYVWHWQTVAHIRADRWARAKGLQYGGLAYGGRSCGAFDSLH